MELLVSRNEANSDLLMSVSEICSICCSLSLIIIWFISCVFLLFSFILRCRVFLRLLGRCACIHACITPCKIMNFHRIIQIFNIKCGGNRLFPASAILFPTNCTIFIPQSLKSVASWCFSSLRHFFLIPFQKLSIYHNCIFLMQLFIILMSWCHFGT